jgi:integrase
VLNLYLDHAGRAVARGELEPVTLEGYQKYLLLADEAFGSVPVDRLRNHHVLAWAESRPGWGPTSRYNAITAVKAAFRWAKRVGHLEANPIVDCPRPTPNRREAIPTAEQTAAIVASGQDAAWRDLMTALVGTGCRPGEVFGLTAADVDLAGATWTVENKTRRKTREPTRTVHLTPAMVELSRRLAERHPEGPIFRNSRGRPWTRNALACRFGRRRRGTVKGMNGVAVGAEGAAYALRHQYITDALEAGVPVATVAELVGHKDATMIMRIYNKLYQRHGHLRDAARLVRPGPDAGPPGDPGSAGDGTAGAAD